MTGAMCKSVGHCRQDRKISRLELWIVSIFFWTVKYFESAANLKMQNEKDTFIFISNIENMESALPLNEKLKNCGLTMKRQQGLDALSSTL